MTDQTSNSCFDYTNQICLSTLQSVARHYGINATGNSIMVQRNIQAVGNFGPDDAISFFNTNPLVSEDCQRAGLPLLCQYFYLICNPNDSSAIGTISAEQCTAVTEGVCETTFNTAKLVGFSIPDCTDLDFDFLSGKQLVTNATNEATNSTETQARMNTNNITCHPQFDVRCGRCVPACKRFSETSKSRQRTIDIFFIIAALTCVIGGTLVIIVSVLRRDVM